MEQKKVLIVGLSQPDAIPSRVPDRTFSLSSHLITHPSSDCGLMHRLSRIVSCSKTGKDFPAVSRQFRPRWTFQAFLLGPLLLQARESQENTLGGRRKENS